MKVLVQKYRIDGEIYDEPYSHIQDLKPGVIVESILVVEEDEEEEPAEEKKK